MRRCAVARSTPHDPLCWDKGHDNPWPYVCPACLIIGRVRADERARWQPQQPVTPHHAPLCWCASCIDEAVGPA